MSDTLKLSHTQVVNGIRWYAVAPLPFGAVFLDDVLGFIPTFISIHSPAKAVEQIMENYVGGWDSFKEFRFEPTTQALSYPEDPTMYPIAFAYTHTKEILWLYPHAWLCVYDVETGEFDVARLD